MTSDPARLGRDTMAAFAARDAAWWDAHIAPGFERHDPGLPFAVRGVAGMHRPAELIHGAFSEVALPVARTVVECDTVLVQLRMAAVHTGDLGGTPATGRRTAIDVMDLFRVDGDRLAEHSALMDTLSLPRQIGAVDA